MDAPVNTRDAEPFFLVWTKTGPHPPRRTYSTRLQAQHVAAAMARKHPDKRWFVLQATDRVWVNEAADKADAGEAINHEHANQ